MFKTQVFVFLFYKIPSKCFIYIKEKRSNFFIAYYFAMKCFCSLIFHLFGFFEKKKYSVYYFINTYVSKNYLLLLNIILCVSEE